MQKHGQRVFQYTDTFRNLLYYLLTCCISVISVISSNLFSAHHHCAFSFCSPQDVARHVDALAAAKVEPERTLQSNLE